RQDRNVDRAAATRDVDGNRDAVTGGYVAGHLYGDLLLSVHVGDVVDRRLAIGEANLHVGQNVGQRSEYRGGYYYSLNVRSDSRTDDGGDAAWRKRASLEIRAVDETADVEGGAGRDH